MKHIYKCTEKHVGNLFDLYELQSRIISTSFEQCNDEIVNIIVHGCNAQGRMGSGFAKELRSRFPGAYAEYENVHNSTGLQLGSNVYYMDDEANVIICNSITQERYGYDGKKYVSYDGIDQCMEKLNDFALAIGNNVHIHFPTIGADLGGGNWNVINAIIESRITDAHKHLYTLK